MNQPRECWVHECLPTHKAIGRWRSSSDVLMSGGGGKGVVSIENHIQGSASRVEELVRGMDGSKLHTISSCVGGVRHEQGRGNG